METKTAIFPGTFDPFTKGHEDIVLRGLRLFDKIIIGIGENTNKSRYFARETIITAIEELFKDHPQIEVKAYQGLTADFAEQNGADYLLRGLRNITDFEYERTVSQANAMLNQNLETVFLITTPELAAISSTIIREIHRNGGDVSAFVPYTL